MVKSKNNSSKKKSYNNRKNSSKRKSRSKKNSKKNSKNLDSTEEMQKIIDMPSSYKGQVPQQNDANNQFVYSPSQIDPLMVNHAVPIDTINPNYKNLVQLGHDIGMQQIQTQMTNQAQVNQMGQMGQMQPVQMQDVPAPQMQPVQINSSMPNVPEAETSGRIEIEGNTVTNNFENALNNGGLASLAQLNTTPNLI